MNVVVLLCLFIAVRAQAPQTNPVTTQLQPLLKPGYNYPQPSPSSQPQLGYDYLQPQPQPDVNNPPIDVRTAVGKSSSTLKTTTASEPQPTIEPQPQTSPPKSPSPSPLPLQALDRPEPQLSPLPLQAYDRPQLQSSPQPLLQPTSQPSPQPVQALDVSEQQPSTESDRIAQSSTSNGSLESPEPTPVILIPKPQSSPQLTSQSVNLSIQPQLQVRLNAAPISQPIPVPQLQPMSRFQQLLTRPYLPYIPSPQPIPQWQPLPQPNPLPLPLPTYSPSSPPILRLSTEPTQSLPIYKTPLQNQQDLIQYYQKQRNQESQQLQQTQHNIQLPLEAVISPLAHMSSYQVDSNQYTSQASGYDEALDETIMTRVLNVLKENEQRSSYNSGHPWQISGLSLGTAQPSHEILSFVRTPPIKYLSRNQNLQTVRHQPTPSVFHHGFSSPAGSQSIPPRNNFGFLPWNPPSTFYGVPH